MAISLKALYDQVQNIKNSGLSVVSKNVNFNRGHIKFSDGLIINYGTGSNVTYSTPFSNTNYALVIGPYGNMDQSLQDFSLSSLTSTGYRLRYTDSRYSGRYIAIGYLITNRLKGWVM